ncbi:cupin domain-containing protein [candidate division KSB1 bacterium]|nr:MAG: cupin domain-containing protein [candidate division KSB1 bacterium]
MNPHSINFNSIDWQSALPGQRAKVFQTQGKQIRIVEFTDQFVEPDWCRRGHIGYVLEGTLEIDFHGEKVIFHAGDGIIISADEADRHKARSLTPVVRLLLIEDI